MHAWIKNVSRETSILSKQITSCTLLIFHCKTQVTILIIYKKIENKTNMSNTFIDFMHKKLKIRGIFARFILLLVMPIVLLQLFNAYFFYDRHWESVSYDLLQSLQNELLYFNKLLEKDGLEQSIFALNAFGMSIEEGKPQHPQSHSGQLDALNNFLTSNISKNSFAALNKDKKIRLYIKIEDTDYTIIFNRRRVLSPTTHIYTNSLVLTALVMLLISFIFLRNQVKIIVKLSAAADRFGKGQSTQKLLISGPFEIRSLTRSFLRMQERISKQIKHRQDLLTHISHDLRTPLTRLRLKLETFDNAKEIEMISEELREVERMLNNYLEFAKAEGNENNKEIELVSHLRSVTSHFYGKRLAFETTLKHLTYSLKPIAFERAINNLIENAMKYSKSIVLITLQKVEGQIYITVEDDGKGIKEELKEELMEPFKKGKESNSYGLGLAIVRTIIHDHGGEMKLLSSKKLGGLKVKIALPI